MSNPRNAKGPDQSASGVTSDLASRIASAKQNRAVEDNRASANGSGDMSGLARGVRIGTEFIAAILVGAGLGYLIDLGLGSLGLHTTPWGMLILLLIGFAAGILNVIRVVAEMNAASPAPPGSDLGPDAEDEERDD